MDDRRADLSKYRQQEAEETLRAAQSCFKEKLYRDTLNRSYYAAFYAVKSLLALDGVDFKRHKDAVSHFNQTYVKNELFSRELGRKLGKLKQLREKSDYDDFYIVSADEAKEQLESATEICQDIQQFLERQKDNSL